MSGDDRFVHPVYQFGGNDDEGQEVERFSEELARRVADLLTEGAYKIPPDVAGWIAENYPHGALYTYTQYVGGGPNPIYAEYKFTREGHIGINLRMANGYQVWSATLRP